MTAVRVSQTAQVTFVVAEQGKNWINRYHVAYTGSGALTATEAINLSNLMSSTWRANFPTVMNAAAELVATEVADIDPLGTATAADLTTASGAQTNAATPVQVAAMCLWRATVPRYRGGRPRTYLGGLDDSFIMDSRKLSVVGQGVIQTAFADFLANVNSSLLAPASRNLFLGYVEARRSNVPLVVPLFRPFTSGAVEQTLRTQRRRAEP